MKRLSKFLCLASLLGSGIVTATLPLRAQQQPVMTVDLTQVSVLSGGTPPGQVAFVDITNVGANYTSPPTVTFVGGGFTTAATAVATINLAGSVSNVIITNPGAGYTSAPTMTFTAPTNPPAGSLGVTAAANAYVGTLFVRPFQNESYGPAGTSIAITALAVGTFPADGFTYEFFVDGISIGVAVAKPQAGTPASIGWTPPRPGSYFLTVVARDGLGHTATSLPVRYFAIGTMITSPTPNTIVPNGSSVVVQATATPQPLNIGGNNAFVKRIDFYVDGAATPFASDDTAPYSFIYTPSVPPTPLTPNNRHRIEARAVDNNDNQVSVNGTAVLDLFMVPPIGTPPTVTISSPANNAVLAIPSGGSGSIPINVSAGSPTGLITKVELYIDGVLFGTSTTFPYTFNWTPTVVGTYRMIALAYDDKSNVVASSIAPASTTLTVAASPTVTVISPTSATSISVGLPITITAAATDSNVGGGISKVQFIVNGTVIGEATTPTTGNLYTFSWTPSVAGGATISARAFNNPPISLSNDSTPVSVTVSTGGTGGGAIIGLPPTVTVTSPIASSLVAVNFPTILSATANDPDGNIASVQFIVNGQAIGGSLTAYPYNTTWTPSSLGTYAITARATDNSGNTVTSSAISVTVGDSSPNPPSVSIVNPINGASLSLGATQKIVANATDDVAVARVQFFVNGQSLGSAVTIFPFQTDWTPVTPGTYTLLARATDNTGNISSSTPVSVTILGTTAPTVSITSPGSGSTARVNNATFVTASASDSDGIVRSVQFFANGVSLGTVTAPPYTVSFVPSSEGVYRLTAVATDNTNAVTTSTTVNVLSVAATSTSADNVYTGNYFGVGTFETGKFALITLGGKTAVFMAASTTTPAKTYFYSGLTANASGSFSLTDGTKLLVSGTNSSGFSPTGTFDGGTKNFFGQSGTPTSGGTIASGYFEGNLTGRPASSIEAIVGLDGTIMIHAQDGSFSDVGGGDFADKVDSSGSFRITTKSGNIFEGTADPATGFLTGKVTGAISANFTGALVTGGTFSDGALRNLSTRGFVGTGGNVLITGFVVGGSTPKRVLIRAVGPTLGSQGISGPLSDPQLQVFDATGTAIPGAGNNDWNASDAAAMTAVGAGALPVGSKDSAFITTLAPSIYTTMVSGVGGATGVALVEFYDLDSPNPYTSQKVVNVSTRGLVGTGQNVLIAGFIISGVSPKKVLIRAVGGPTLTAIGVAEPTLPDPFVTLLRAANNTSTVVRENDNWQSGNDASLIAAACAKTGATPLPPGSKDASILITLPPGAYTAIVSGSGATNTGIALVEVFEVP